VWRSFLHQLIVMLLKFEALLPSSWYSVCVLLLLRPQGFRWSCCGMTGTQQQQQQQQHKQAAAAGAGAICSLKFS
jgi:hypothetical protein